MRIECHFVSAVDISSNYAVLVTTSKQELVMFLEGEAKQQFKTWMKECFMKAVPQTLTMMEVEHRGDNTVVKKILSWTGKNDK